MMSGRETAKFDPKQALCERWPEWTVYLTKLHGVNEVINSPRRLILIDADDGGADWALAHALAHLDLEHHLSGPGGEFSKEQEGQADWLARIWLDDVQIPADDLSAFPLDGEPTLQIP